MARILIVDDSEVQLFALRKILAAAEHEVIAADNGAEGVELAISQQPDVILMDVVMPGMSGFQATRKLARHGNTANIPVIFVTTKDQETDRIWGMRQGAVDYITKPAEPKHLLATIERILEQQQ